MNILCLPSGLSLRSSAAVSLYISATPWVVLVIGILETDMFLVSTALCSHTLNVILVFRLADWMELCHGRQEDT
jgi:hypothetical protein